MHSDAAALTASPEAQKLEPRAAAAVATLLQQGSSAAAFDNPELLIAIVAQVSPRCCLLPLCTTQLCSVMRCASEPVACMHCGLAKSMLCPDRCASMYSAVICRS